MAKRNKNLRISLSLREQHVVEAALHGKTVTVYLREALDEKLARDRETEPQGYKTEPIMLMYGRRRKGAYLLAGVVLSDEEQQTVKAAAGVLGLTPQDYLRVAVNEKLPSGAEGTQQDQEAEQPDPETRRQLEHDADLEIANNTACPRAEREAARERLARRREASGD